MLRPHRWIIHNHEYAMQMIWHHDKGVRFYIREMKRNGIPAIQHNLTIAVNLYFTLVSDITEE